ncbi:MAG: methyltransferase domain-containing protein, partial [Dehalococcoidia bacterium]|nr:methyltransferase domain-containing protein [Dehalococcoidia bacterium]
MDRDRPSVPADAYNREGILSLNAPGEYQRFLEDGELRPRLARAVALADLEVGQWVLDLGCGRGEVALHCAQKASQVLALDYSSDCLSLTTQAAMGTCGIRGQVAPVQGDSKHLPVRANSLSRVLMLDVAEHLYPWELELTLAEAQRVLKPGGFLVLHTLPNRWALDVGYRWARFLFRKLPAEPRSQKERAIHVNEQDILGLYRALARAGFSARVWLEDSILSQAQWQQGGSAFPPSDQRARVYPLLVNPFFRALYRLALATPLRFILANDI